MNAADPQGSPSGTGGGSSSTPPEARSQPEVIVVNDSKAVLVIAPALVYDMKGEAYALPANIVKAVNQFTVSDGYRREGSRERPFMYSVGVYVVQFEEEDDKHKYFCLADPTRRKNKPTFPYKKGDSSNVNTHHEESKKLLNLCSVRRVHTEPYPGYLPGYYPTKNFCKFCVTFIPVPGNTVSSVRPWPQYPGNGYNVCIPFRNFCEFRTPLPQYPELL